MGRERVFKNVPWPQKLLGLWTKYWHGAVFSWRTFYYPTHTHKCSLWHFVCVCCVTHSRRRSALCLIKETWCSWPFNKHLVTCPPVTFIISPIFSIVFNIFYSPAQVGFKPVPLELGRLLCFFTLESKLVALFVFWRHSALESDVIVGEKYVCIDKELSNRLSRTWDKKFQYVVCGIRAGVWSRRR